MILVIDNYDSFVFNLARYLSELGEEPEVLRNDALTVDTAIASAPDAILISPGPCGPKEAGISTALVQAAAEKHIPLLGVCLGHQCIVEAFGGRIARADAPRHGKASAIAHNGTGIFEGLPSPLTVGRYHSLIAEMESLPDCLSVTARTNDQAETVMGVAHESLPVFGVQFHPESVLTEHGHDLLANFLRHTGRQGKAAAQ